MPYAVLILAGQVVVFNVADRRTGDGNVGICWTVEIHNLIVPTTFESRREEIKQIIGKALEEDVYCDPFADGGTVANPNMVARKNIKSFSVKFN